MSRVISILIAAGLVIALPVVALAHAGLVSSDPANGATIETPYTLTATFDDVLTPDGSSIVIIDAGGAQVAAGTVDSADPHVMTAELPSLPDGQYTVRWTAVSADDAAVERGTYTFNSRSVGPALPGDGAPATDSNDAIIALGLAAIVIVGVLAFIFLRRRR